MSSWLKEKGSGIGGSIAAFVAILQLFVVAPMNQRFDAMEKHVDQRIDDLTALMNQRFDAQDQRFDAQDRRFDAQDQRLDRLEEGIRNFDRRVSRNEGQIES